MDDTPSDVDNASAAPPCGAMETNASRDTDLYALSAAPSTPAAPVQDQTVQLNGPTNPPPRGPRGGSEEGGPAQNETPSFSAN
jgi:hypothetical protein